MDDLLKHLPVPQENTAPGLTSRETAVLRMIAEGMDTAQHAETFDDRRQDLRGRLPQRPA